MQRKKFSVLAQNSEEFYAHAILFGFFFAKTQHFLLFYTSEAQNLNKS